MGSGKRRKEEVAGQMEGWEGAGGEEEGDHPLGWMLCFYPGARGRNQDGGGGRHLALRAWLGGGAEEGPLAHSRQQTAYVNSYPRMVISGGRRGVSGR